MKKIENFKKKFVIENKFWIENLTYFFQYSIYFYLKSEHQMLLKEFSEHNKIKKYFINIIEMPNVPFLFIFRIFDNKFCLFIKQNYKLCEHHWPFCLDRVYNNDNYIIRHNMKNANCSNSLFIYFLNFNN